MKSSDVKDNTYLVLLKKLMIKILNLKLLIILEYRIIKKTFAKRYTPNLSEEVFAIKKFKSTIPWAYVINDLNGKEIIGTFYEKELQKTNQQGFRIEKVIKRKGNKLYVRWKGCDNSLINWWKKIDW